MLCFNLYIAVLNKIVFIFAQVCLQAHLLWFFGERREKKTFLPSIWNVRERNRIFCMQNALTNTSFHPPRYHISLVNSTGQHIVLTDTFHSMNFANMTRHFFTEHNKAYHLNVRERSKVYKFVYDLFYNHACWLIYVYVFRPPNTWTRKNCIAWPDLWD